MRTASPERSGGSGTTGRGSDESSLLGIPGPDRRFPGRRWSRSPFGSGKAIGPKDPRSSSFRLHREYDKAPRGALSLDLDHLPRLHELTLKALGTTTQLRDLTIAPVSRAATGTTKLRQRAGVPLLAPVRQMRRVQPRSGVVEEVPRGDPSPRNRTCWDDGHQIITRPKTAPFEPHGARARGTREYG
jgi:hypothetical protein